MDKKYQDFENSVKRKHSFRFTPEFREEFSINIKPRIFTGIAVKTFESSGWDIVHQDENQIEAKRKEFQLLALLCYYLLLIKEGYYKALYDAINIAPHCFWLTI